ncbi:hypothetical protein SAMD00019534_118420 [Acytostelium subglobosum LB1]|uniref:hypothetical protein n=1 Tax=Acytostelium subglobosum LB1 TaxID=1410327 RepID=UPI00064510B5|nr:hypothetical protein SAMD00019534_118420 [Acytostelium subglobosum LB1]GAM28666.1 hypothetical protein SAMD00019534_118420 [Acytostelium subglobosum LB1]|eukprot:XP_012748444.1 hypothetical protein SAMD00019534_118420 [Acytostelium subglobosum LB1]
MSMSKIVSRIPPSVNKWIPEYVVEFAKRYPFTTAQIGLYAFALIAGKLVKLYKSIIPNNTIIEIDLANATLVTKAPSQIDQILEPNSVYYRDIIDGLRKAADDPKIIGLIFRLGNTNTLNLAALQELRRVVHYFRSKGKSTAVFTDTFGEFAAAPALYYFASAFENVYLSPCGAVNIINLRLDHPFLKKMLDKVGTKTEFIKRKDFKSAANIFTEESFTEADRESTTSLVEDLIGVMIEAIAKDRGMSVDHIRELFGSGPFSAETALKIKLVDGLYYVNEAYDQFKDRIKSSNPKIKKTPNMIYLPKYLSLCGKLNTKSRKNKIAFIEVEGQIHCGKSLSKMNGGPTIGSESLRLAIRAATLDKSIKCIIIRVDSPGGSYVASCIVWNEIERAKKAGKKVIVSMGSVAASGGYFIACNADKILAEEGTITGSIGVLVGKINYKQTVEKIGVTFDAIRINANENDSDDKDNSSLFSSLHDYNQMQRDFVNQELDVIYEDFTKKVSEGRKLTRDEVEASAQGRVWTGKQALERKLVDKIGGMHEAIELAKEACSIPKEENVQLVSFPKENLIEMLLSSSQPYNSEETDKKGVPVGINTNLCMGVSNVSKVVTTLRSLGILDSLFQVAASRLPNNLVSAVNMELNRQPVSLQADSGIINSFSL